MEGFELVTDFVPRGDQPQAIDALSRWIAEGRRHQVLLGVTGSGKTFTIAQVIARVAKPTLVIAPNKTLAAQLYHEFRALFPRNAVEYFVSYYDYYQPEAYIPASDTYIQKDSSINEMIDKMRHSATRSVLSRRDTIVVASVSCIFGLGAPEDYLALRSEIGVGDTLPREQLIAALVKMHYERNDVDFHRGVFRVRGDRVEIFPAYEEETALRVDFFGDQIEAVGEIDPLRGIQRRRLTRAVVYPASHYVTQQRTLKRATATILDELKSRIAAFRDQKRLLEAQRIEERTHYDLEMLQELGYCNGIENYSRHPCSTTSRPIFWSASTKAISACLKFGPCTRATVHARRPSWSMASGFRRPWTTARCGSRNSPPGCLRWFTSRPPRPNTNASWPGMPSPNRSCAPPG
jgi:excinuclease ABC subunit B